MRKSFVPSKLKAVTLRWITISALLCLSILRIYSAPLKSTMVLLWNASSEPYASLTRNGSLKIGDRIFVSRIEGEGAGPQSFSILRDATSSTGHVLHYVVLAQEHDGHKARAEHYLHIEPLNTTFFSEFSIKLDPENTLVDAIRPDGGENWCLLRQWHQGIAVPPPLALRIEKGTNNVVSWGVISSSDPNGRNSSSHSFGEKKLELGRWYHFRVRWNISPDEHGGVLVMMSETKLPKDLTYQDTLFRYDGPIGYRVKNWDHPEVSVDGDEHAPNTVREQQGIYQGAHIDPKSHHGFSLDNVAIYRAPNG